MTLSSPRPRALARPLLLLAAAVALLSACNPLTAPMPGSGLALIVQYTGPNGAWYELSLSGVDGYEATVSISIFGSEPHERLCRDAATGQVEACVGHPGLVNLADPFVGSGTYRAVVSPVNWDWLSSQVTCRQGGATVACPESLRLSMRVVDAQGNPVGDFTTTS